jgi:hypothetical protein
VDLAVLWIVQQDAVGAAPVAAGATRLLHVLLQRRRRLVVDDEADVGLVDAETEGARRDHDGPAPGFHVELLLGDALRAGHLSVIVVRRHTEGQQAGVHGVHLTRGGAVDDAGTLQPVGEAGEGARALVAGRLDHLEREIRAVG